MGALFFAVGLLQANAVWLNELAEGGGTPASRFFACELTGAMSAFVLLPIVRTAVLNAPVSARRWLRFFGFHALGCTLYSSLHVALMLGSRSLLYPLFGWGPYHYGPLPLRVPMEWHKDVLSYVIMATVVEGVTIWRRSQTRRLREAELETRLREAQLRALGAQLDPHFLFNALNTMSSLMYEDVARTDRLLADLGELLRANLDVKGPCWTFEEERLHTARYIAILLARFGDRLACVVETDPRLDRVQVPRFILQRLVENAVKHNPDPTDLLHVRASASLSADRVEIEVVDDGVGFENPTDARRTGGVGLRGLAESLALLHGDRATVDLANAPDGGARVTVRMPAEAVP